MNAVVTIGSLRTDHGGDTVGPTLRDSGEIAQIPEGDMREMFLYDDVWMRIGAFNFTQGTTPLLDFCMSLQFALRGLAVAGKSTMSFPDVVTRVRFTLDDATVNVRSTSEADGRGECSFLQLTSAVCLFQRSALDAVTRDNPDLLFNDLVERLFREYGVRELGEEQFARHTQAMRRRYSG
ncbi:hypothetical protein ACFOVU_15700 [Nocardiopsis sediminis]|uniref:Uncharacterized protein n=1 Tax=Nocardiopsis sediminis TaxID=1778267 RepID=A0ABV8FMJ1_9ACTN